MLTNLTRREGMGIPRIAPALFVGFWLMASAGCSSDSALAPERTWEEVRYHWTESSGGYYGDAVVRATGEVQWDLQGTRVPARGLLAGENLETLTRLIGALPPAGYHGGETDDPRRVFMSVRIGDEVRSYSTTLLDANAPQALRDVGQQMEFWAESAASDRREAVASRVLLEGQQSGLLAEGRFVVRSRDDLLLLVAKLGSGQPGILPSVDFRREIVVGIFLGRRPTGGYTITVPQAAVTEAGQIVLSELRGEPGARCAVAGATTSPFVLVAVEARPDRDLLFEVQTVTYDCPADGAR